MSDMVTHDRSAGPERPSFRVVLIRVLAVQVVALALLWLLQARYGG
jgi:hypothetical protein